MSIILPPGTDSSPSVGTITFIVTPVYLNTTAASVSFLLKLWGVKDPVTLENEEKTMIRESPNQKHSLCFKVTTNLQKLTSYFYDTNAIIITLCESRTGKQLGNGYLKIRRYIVNNLLSEFEQKIQLKSTYNRQKNILIGQIIISAKINVPLTILSIKETQGRQDKNYEIQSEPSREQLAKIRKLVVEPHIFQQTTNINQNNLKHFIIEKKKEKSYENNQSRIEQKDQRQMAEILKAMNSKEKPAQKNWLQFIEQDSLRDYPNIQQLGRRYGRNNVDIQKMRLELDEAKYLKKNKSTRDIIDQGVKNSQGFLLKFTNFQTVLSLNSNSLNDFQIELKCSERDQSLLNRCLVKDLIEDGIYVGSLSIGNLIEIENKNLKGKYVIRKSNIEGETAKIGLKRKDNSKKIGQIQLKFQNLSALNAGSKRKQKEGEIRQEFSHYLKQQQKKQQSRKKMHYYISVKESNPNKYNQIYFLIHPDCQKQATKGKKMIFTSQKSTQAINIITQNQRNIQTQEFKVYINPSVKMKEQVVKTNLHNIKVFTAVADSIEQLMKIVVCNDTEKRSQNIVPEQHKKEINKNTVLNGQISRKEKFNLIIQIFQRLIQTSNGDCANIIRKLSSNLVSIDQQTVLFESLCIKCQMNNHQLVTSAYLELLHGQFSMFWSCFLDYKKWNEIYWHCLQTSIRQFLKMLKKSDQQYSLKSNQRKIKRFLDKTIEKLYKNREMLFGLLPFAICQQVFMEHLQSFLCRQQLKQNSKIENIESQFPSKIGKQNSQIYDAVQSILKMLCRYDNQNQVHCLKIEEVSFVLQGRVPLQRLYLNDHQLISISSSTDSRQILFELAKSCLSVELIKSKNCDGLKQILSQIHKIELSESRSSQNLRIDTQNGTHKMTTQQMERVHTQQLMQRQEKPKKSSENSMMNNFQNIKLQFQKICFSKNGNLVLNNISYRSQLSVIDSQTKKLEFKIRSEQFPFILPLLEMKDYDVNVSFYHKNGQDEEEPFTKLYGIFIASENIERILLYDQKKSSQKQVGWIEVGNNLMNKDDEDLVIQIKNEEIFPIHHFHESNGLPLQIEENERNKIMKQIIDNRFNVPSFAYKILSINPSINSQDEYLISLQGADQIIRYPNMNVFGKVNNIEPQNDTVKICIKSNKLPFLPQQQYESTIKKRAGVHEVCFQRANNSLFCIVTIEFTEYLGEQIVKNYQTTITRIILMNVFHLNYFKSFQSSSQLYTLVVTTDSEIDPFFSKDFQPQQLLVYQKPMQNCASLRTSWIGLTIKLPPSNAYNIAIYRRQGNKRLKFNQDNMIAYFQFKLQFHPSEIGVFSQKGYLFDEKGYRLALNVLQINYNDVFSKDTVGKLKFENLLTVFQLNSILKLCECDSEESLKGSLRSNFGFNNVQIHLLMGLFKQPQQLLKILRNWRVQDLIHNKIDLNGYSIADLFSQYEIYDFQNSGAIPIQKVALINKLVFGTNQIQNLDLQEFMISRKSGWIKDLKSPQQNGSLDYLFILWCFRRYAGVDDFFMRSEKSDHIHIDKRKQGNETTNVPHNSFSISKINSIQIQLLGFRNLKVEGRPATLTFYINGQKMANPIPRCITHQYESSNRIVTNWPIVLEIYNKSYGTKQLYSQKLIQTVKVYEQKVFALGGQIFFYISDEQGRMSKDSQTKNNGKEFSNQRSLLEESRNVFRQSRKQKWQNLKQSMSNTRKISSILMTK